MFVVLSDLRNVRSGQRIVAYHKGWKDYQIKRVNARIMCTNDLRWLIGSVVHLCSLQDGEVVSIWSQNLRQNSERSIVVSICICDITWHQPFGEVKCTIKGCSMAGAARRRVLTLVLRCLRMNRRSGCIDAWKPARSSLQRQRFRRCSGRGERKVLALQSYLLLVTQMNPDTRFWMAVNDVGSAGVLE